MGFVECFINRSSSLDFECPDISLRRMSVNLNHSSDSEAELLWEQLIPIQLFHVLAFFETQKQKLTVGPTSPGGPFSPLLPRVPVAPWKPCRHYRLTIQLFPNFLVLFKGSRGTHGGSSEDPSKGAAALSFLPSHKPTAQSSLCVSHAHIISHHHLNYGQASKAEFYQQIAVLFVPYRFLIFYYIFRFRHSLEHNPLLQPLNTTWFSFSFKTCAGL